MTAGECIRKIRTEKGMTQKQLAEACGMADSAIRKYESGIVRPKLATISRIAEALGVDTLALTRGDPYYPITFTVPVEHLEEAVTALFYGNGAHKRVSKALNLLNDSGQQEAVKRVEELTEIPRYRRPESPLPTPAGTDTPAGEKPAEGN